MRKGRSPICSWPRQHPELSLALAEILATQDADAAARWATAAVDHFASATQEHPDDADSQFCYLQALHLAHRDREAVQKVRIILARINDARIRSLAGDLYAAWCATLTGEDKAAERLRRVEEGLELAPASGPLLQGLAAAASGTGPVATAAQMSIDHRLAAGGPAAVALRLALGIEAQRRGDITLARRLIGEAYRDDPESPVAANNLACLLILGANPSPTRALGIIDAALKSHADEPVLRDTRGQILVHLCRWKEAASDLEFALSRIPANAETHRALALAYRGLSLVSLAEAQERKAAEACRTSGSL